MNEPYKPPYMAVIFSSVRSSDQEGYDEMDVQTFKAVEEISGYLGAESYASNDGKHVTIAYFRTENDIAEWRHHSLHQQAQKLGKEKWYEHYRIRICRVERDYEFNK